ncbi:MAG TPA: DUF488 domain-containing protein [Pirellulales bacterium]|jgi:uncharacterized protein (DUF488 family)|nr:DUF488 domain-containing protein [Pirellulales bacterium]
MFNRQKLLIYLLRLANRPVSRTELTKWCFLLRHECESSGGSAFYDFLPYLYGPFSFALYQEVVKLVSQHYIIEVGENQWSLNPYFADTVGSPGKDLERDAQRLMSRFGTKETTSLIDYIYESYPAFTVNSTLRKLATKPTADAAVFTAGYEGLSIDAFLNLLVTSGVRCVIDVRNNPIARRYGFHKSTLQRLAKKLDIDYFHFPEVGIRSEDRQSLDNKRAYEALFDKYEKTVLKRERLAIRQIGNLMLEQPSVLVCMEAQPKCCHRSRLATAVARETRLRITHLAGNS